MTDKHFGGKSVVEHLKEARARGAIASAEIHGTEMPGYLAAAADAARETALILAILYLVFPVSLSFLLLVSSAILIWKVGRSAMLGWSRLERLHRLIEEERWEIEHDRKQEEEELTALYAAKGFSGQLLKDVVSTLASDDNRLLRVMLEEEMGLTLEVYEHPLKQCLGAGVGVILAAILCSVSSIVGPWLFAAAVAALFIASATVMARLQKNRPLEAIIWNLALLAFALGTVYLLKKI